MCVFFVVRGGCKWWFERGAGGCGEKEMRGKKRKKNKRICKFKFKVKSHMSSMACMLQMVYVTCMSHIASATLEIVLDFKLFFSLCYFTIFFIVIKKKLLSLFNEPTKIEERVLILTRKKDLKFYYI
jgi:hypothetical protein